MTRHSTTANRQTRPRWRSDCSWWAGRRTAILTVAFAWLVGLLPGSATTAAAQERFYFPAYENAKTPIIQKINAETVRIDVATWYLTDREITQAIVNRFKAGIPVRVLGDRVSIFEIDANTRREYEFLASNGVPIRLRYHPTWFPYIMHWKAGIFVGQNVVEFGSANWTTFELAPWSSTNFKDETVLFTDDSSIVNAFKTKFDQMWVDTTDFMDWAEAYRRETGTTWSGPTMSYNRNRIEPDHPVPSGLIFSQGSELTNAMTSEISAETAGIDFVVYRLSVSNITNALVNRLNAGVPVRVMIEPTQYRRITWPEYWLTGARIDQLWVAGARVRERVHDGLTHAKVLITSRTGMQGSSNFTANWQRDHNYFIPANTKPVLYNALRDEFNRMWNDTTNYRNFYPKPPNAASLAAPGNGATGVSLTPTLVWNRAPWAVAYDVYLGTSSSNLAFQGRVNAVLTEDPPLTYSWTPPSSLAGSTTYYWRIVSRTFATAVDPSLIATSSTWAFVTQAGSGGSGSTPYTGTAVALPGTIQAENFDNGGQGVAYYDTTTGNSGGQYRATDVDIESTADSGGGHNLGWMAPGEWLNYSVSVASAGTYDLEFRVASKGGGGTFRLEVNGTDKTGTLTFPNTGGWQSWVTVRKTGVSLSAGTQMWRLVILSAGSTGAVGNVNWIRATATSTSSGSTPFGGTPVALPGTVQAENFDDGGQNVAYYDTTSGNSGGHYRSTDVDIETTSDSGGGYNVGWMAVGEWLKYTVNVGTSGTYDLEFRVAANGSGGTFRLEVDGVDKTGTMTIPNTGGWQNWTTVRRTGVSLNAGQQVWRFLVLGTGSTGIVGNVNWIRLVSASSTTTAPEIVIYAADVPSGNVRGNWAHVSDSTAAAGIRLSNADRGAGVIDPPLASPADYFDVTFNAQAGVRYRLWLRMKAAGNSKWNDSVHVQFSGSVNGSGSPIYRIGTTQGLRVNLATTAEASELNNWGWQNRAYWLADTGEVWFASSGTQTMRIQIREDGVSVDQFVLSPSRYLTSAPGPVGGDSTIVPKS
jgi:hypothetical protein